jgi:hypothetical protein
MSEIDLKEWNRWFNKFVHPVFEIEERESYFDKIKRLQTPFYPKYWVAEQFYTKLKDDNRFDSELKEFFAFLYSCGFFMDNIISFEEWLSMKCWQNPLNESFESETILELLNKDNGIQELKQILRWLPFINRQDGF